MRVKVKLLADFRPLFGARERDISLAPGARLRDLLEAVCDTPERRARVLTPEGDVQPQVVILADGTPAGAPGGLEMPLRDGTVVAVFPFLGGG